MPEPKIPIFVNVISEDYLPVAGSSQSRNFVMQALATRAKFL